MNFYIRILIIFTLFTMNSAYIQAEQQQTRNPNFIKYIEKYRVLAIRLQQEYKIPASIKLAQGLLETAAGNSRLARVGNNHFGIKCKEEWTGGKMYHDDDAIGECFRTYKSAEDSYLDHSLFLSQRRFYVALFDLDIYDYKGWAHGLQKSGYATDKAYGEKLIRIIETYELHKYDKARIVSKPRAQAKDDIYTIPISTPETKKEQPGVESWKRRIHQTNGIHYITARKGDSYDIIAYDTHLKLKKLLKYNETTREYNMKEGDIVYLQGKKKYASKGNKTHTVAGGESLYSISQKYGMKLKSLYKLNKLKKDYTPKKGDILKVRK